MPTNPKNRPMAKKRMYFSGVDKIFHPKLAQKNPKDDGTDSVEEGSDNKSVDVDSTLPPLVYMHDDDASSCDGSLDKDGLMDKGGTEQKKLKQKKKKRRRAWRPKPKKGQHGKKKR